MLSARTLRIPVAPLAFAFAFVASLALAHAAPDSARVAARQEKRVDHFVGKMEKELKLSKEQSEKIRAILRKDPVAPPEGDGKGGPGMRGGMMGLHRELAAQLRAGAVDTAALDRSFEERVTRMRAHHASMLAKIAEVSAVLTPEQRKKAADWLEKRGAKMEKRHHRMCGKDCSHG
jgi:Spy/CpxP family protein refolding chaperone